MAFLRIPGRRFPVVLWLIITFSFILNGQDDGPVGKDSTTAKGKPVAQFYHYENEYMSITPLMFLLLEVNNYQQDENSIDQVGNNSDRYEPGQIRAIRLGAVGLVKFQRPWRYIFAVGYRAFDVGFDTDSTSTFTIYDARLDIPTAIGTFALGKLKEPISMQRITAAAFLPGFERPMQLDGLLAARNIGIQWRYVFPSDWATIELGIFNNWLQTGRSFARNPHQITGRLTLLPFNPVRDNHLVHLGIGGKLSKWNGIERRAKATPEAYFAPNYVDTGFFPGESSKTLSLEAAWSFGPYWINSEYVGSWVKSDARQDPFFSGFHIDASWAITGERRLYNASTGIFGYLIPEKDVNEGGLGAVELLIRYSQIDLNGGTITGGAMNRWTIGFNWYPVFKRRFSAHYGYVTLDRFATIGIVHIFQIRYQIIL